MVQTTVEPIQQQIVLGEIVRIRLTIANTGAEAVTVPDPLKNDLEPEYVLTYPDGTVRTVNYGAAHLPDPTGNPRWIPRKGEVTLAPQARLSQEIPLSRLAPLVMVGTYNLQVTMRTKGGSVASHPVTFEIVRAGVTCFSLAPTTSGDPSARLSVVWAATSAEGTYVVEEVRLGGHWANPRQGKLYTSRTTASKGVAVSSVALATLARPRGAAFKNWTIWAEDKRLFAQRTDAGKRVWNVEPIYTGDGKLELISPGVMDGDYNLEVFVVDTMGKNRLVHLMVPWKAAGQSKKISMIDLPGAPRAALPLFMEVGAQHLKMVFVLVEANGKTTLIRCCEQCDPSMKLIATMPEGYRVIPGMPLAVACAAGGAVISVATGTVRSDDGSAYVFDTKLTGKQFDKALTTPSRIPFPTEPQPALAHLARIEDGFHILLCDNAHRFWYACEKSLPRPVDLPLAPISPFALFHNTEELFVAGVAPGGQLEIVNLSTELSSSQPDSGEEEQEEE